MPPSVNLSVLHTNSPALPLTAKVSKYIVGYGWDFGNMTKHTPNICLFSSLSQTGGGKALSRLKHLQQSGSDKNKTSKQRDDFLKTQGQQQV